MLASGTLGVQSTRRSPRDSENATRAAGLVRNLLAFAETADLTRRWHDINDVMDRAVARIRTELDAAGVVVQFVRAEGLPLMYVDARQIEKVVATLLSRSAARPAATWMPPDRFRSAAAHSRRLARHRGRQSRGLRPGDEATSSRRSRGLPPDRPGARRIARGRHPGSPATRFHLELPVTPVGGGEQSAANGASAWTTSSTSSTSTANAAVRGTEGAARDAEHQRAAGAHR